MAILLLLRKNNTNDETIQTEGFGEDKNKNHGNEETVLLAVGTNTSISDDTNSKTRTQTTKTTGETGAKVGVAGVSRVRSLDCER